MPVTAVDPFVDAVDLTVDDDGQIMRASARIRSYCRWHIYPNITEEITLNGSGSRFLMLPSLHVTDVNAVTEDAVTLATTEYEWSQDGQLWKASPWTGHFRAVTVDYDHGHELLPEDVRDVCIALAVRLPKEDTAATAEQAGGVSRQYGGLLSGQAAVSAPFTAAELVTLDRYRIGNRP